MRLRERLCFDGQRKVAGRCPSAELGKWLWDIVVVPFVLVLRCFDIRFGLQPFDNTVSTFFLFADYRRLTIPSAA